MNSAPPLTDLSRIGALPHSTLSVCALHQLCSRASLIALSRRFHSAPTQLLLHSHAAIKLQLRHLSRGTVTDAHRRVYSLQHLPRVSLARRRRGRRARGHLLAPHARLLLPHRERQHQGPGRRGGRSLDPLPQRGRARWQRPALQLHDLSGEAFMLLALLSRLLHWGQVPATYTHVENEDGIWQYAAKI